MAIELTAENQSILMQAYADTPTELRDLLDAQIVQAVSNRAKDAWGLTDTQQTAVENELVLVLLQLEFITELKDVLVKEAGIGAEAAEFIVTDFNEKLPPSAFTLLTEFDSSQNETDENSESHDIPTPLSSSTIEQVPPEAPSVSTETPSAEAQSIPSTDKVPNIPRYAKPLTDLPRYNEKEQ